MDPNSAHQLWSRWVATVVVPFHPVHTTPVFFEEMKRTTANVYRQMFGSASEMKITHRFVEELGLSEFVVECRTEGSPAPDMTFRERQKKEIGQFFGKNLRRYGEVKVHLDIFIEAGDVGDGKPPAQLIIGPSLDLMPRTKMFSH